jgi:hypothetical protein
MLLAAGPASATVVDPTPLDSARLGSNTELRLSGLGPGTSVTGFIANASTPFDPTTGYPTTNPGTGWTPKNEGFAGVIHATPVGGGATLSMYCIDILTETNIGIGYQLGTWDDANVPNVGFVARVLEVAYPNTNEPAALTDLNIRRLPAGSTCTVAEVINGSTADVTVASAGSGQQVAVTPGGAGSAELVNAVEPVSVEPTMPATLPGTGGGSDAGNVVPAGLAAAVVGALLVLLTRRRTS